MSKFFAPEYSIFSSKEVVSRPEVEYIFAESEVRRKAIFILEGDRGAGKTTTLLSLFDRYLIDNKFQPFYIGLSPYNAPEFARRENIYLDSEKEVKAGDIPAILERLAKHLNIRYAQMEDANIQREYLARQLAQRRRVEKTVILIDSIYESESEIQQQIESDILIPLLASDEVIIILSGRGKRPIWSSPEFRNAEIIQLKNFVQKNISEQLQKMGSKHIGEIEKITRWSGGCPLVVRVLGKAKQVDLEALNKAINILIQDGLRRKYRKQAETLRPQIEKIALLQPFREVEVENYLFGDNDKKRSLTKSFVFALNESSLLTWDDQGSRRGLRLNETVAHPIQEWLFEQGGKYDKYKKEWNQSVNELISEYPNVNKEEYLGMFKKAQNDLEI